MLASARADTRRAYGLGRSSNVDREALRALLRSDFRYFLRRAFREVSPGSIYSHGWHLDAIAEALMATWRGEIRRLIVNVMPRSLKSITGAIAFPAWGLGHRPESQWMAGSYAENLAFAHSVDCRHLIRSGWYREIFPGTVLSDDQDEKRRFQTTRRGHRIATSVGSSAIGQGADFLICDDPHDPQGVLAEAERVRACNWYDRTFIGRLNDRRVGRSIVIMQRLHQADLTGHLLEKGGYTHLKLPAEFKRRTMIEVGNFRRECQAGELTDPVRLPRSTLEETKRDLGSWAYAGQYDQEPAPLEGAIIPIDKAGRYRERPVRTSFRQIVQSWDTANKANELAAWTVCTTWGVMAKPGAVYFYLLDVLRQRLTYPKLRQTAPAHAKAWSPHLILIEDKGSGTQLLQDLRASTSLPIRAIEPVGEKIVRASNQAPAFENGTVVLPHEALGLRWLSDYELELRIFPNVAYLDQVDSTSQFLEYIRSHSIDVEASSAGPRESGATATRRGTAWGTSRIRSHKGY